MDYESLASAYWQRQLQRVSTIVANIIDRESDIAAGRVIPETDDLAIGTGRRLNVAVMFIDICDFSSRSSENAGDQQTVLRALNLFFTEMIRIAKEYGGTVEKNTGDGLMAYFEDNGGTPPAGGCLRATSAALTMMYATRFAINPILTVADIAPINFRVTIDHGTVTIAKLGAARGFSSIVAVGTRANVASKMLKFADKNEILIGASVQARLPEHWQRWCELKTTDSGWFYSGTNIGYPLYTYKGRWRNPS